MGLVPLLAGAHGTHPTKGSASVTTEQLYGTIHEIVIRDQVAGMTVRQLTLQPAQGASVALHGTGVDTLKSGATVSVTGRRNGSDFEAQSLQTVAAGAMQKAAASRTVQGKLAMLHADNDDGTSSYLYEVHGDDGSVTALDMPIRPQTLAPGMRVSATGSVTSATGALVPDQIDVLALGSQNTIQGATVNKVLVILLKFSDTGADPFPVSTAQNVMTGATNSVANFYNEVSYGQQQLAVTITPWVTSATMATPSTCDWSGAGHAADVAATAAGYTATYDFRVYVFPRISACGWSGLGYISYPHYAYINGTTAMQTLVVAHEMGHNFGLLHAASLDCGSLSIAPSGCSSSEYGDPFDVMGNQRAMHFNAAQKNMLGWFAASAVKTHSTGSATYTLSPIETAGGSTYAVKIPALAKRTYWLEYRQPVGIDAGLSSFATNGVQVRVEAPFEQLCGSCADDTEFLDMTPATSAFTDGALTVGNTFRDETGLSINVLSATASSVTVNVGWGAVGVEVPAPDVDGSGTTDLLWRNSATGLSTAWMMSGGAMSWASALLSSASWGVVADGDFNADGKADLVWHNSATGDTALWLMNNGVMSTGATLLSDPNWTVAFTGDFDGDGKSDLLWHNSATGETAIWLMNGLTMKSGAIIMSNPQWAVTAVGDFDGDGKADLVWRNSVTGETALWLMNGTAMKSGAIVVVDPNWKLTNVGDLNGDGKTDLIWYNSVTGATNVWLMNGLTMTSGATIRVDVNTHVTHVGDLNNDGKADLIWRNDVSGATIATLMNGTTTVSSATLLTDPLTKVTNLGDFNGDGNADLIWRNTSTGVTTLWLMNGLTMTSSSVLVTDPNWSVVNPK
jgi:hypothetical protein